MKPAFYPFIVVVTAICMASCHQEVEITVDNTPDPPVWTFNSDDVELGTTDFDTFDIELDYSQLNERLYTDPSNQMYVENSKFGDVINVVYKGDKAVVSCENSSDFSIKTDGAHVTINTNKDVACTLTGATDNGSLKIIGDNKVCIKLNGLKLKNAQGPSINNQSKQICFLVTDSISELRDDSIYADLGDSLKQKGCVYSKGPLAISGKAPLKIIANGADAIHSGKTLFVRRGSNINIESNAGSAIKAKKKVMVEGGMLNILSSGRGGHGITAKEIVQIDGGRTTIISNTGPGKNGKNSRCINSDSIVAIMGGMVRVKDSSVGGKGIRAGHKFHAKNCIVDVLTFGTDDKVTGSKNRGIKGTDEIRIDSARVRVRTENGWNEGLSSRRKVMINNSLVELKTRDDAISAGEPKTSDIEINNGRVYSISGMDAIDSNGTIHINSGLVFVIGQSKLCRGFDCDINEFKIGFDAIVVSLGQITSPPTVKLLEHPACFVTRPINDKEFCLSTTGMNDNLISFKTPDFRFSDTGFRALVSIPEFKQNVSYDFCNGAIVKPKHTFHGLAIGGTVENKSVTDRHTFTKNYNEL